MKEGNDMTAPTKELVVQQYKLTALDRCDACGISSRAYTRFIKGARELHFCVHHYNKHLPKLASEGWSVDNQSDILDAEIAAYNKKDAIT